jgi:hypothetical protein
VSLAILLDKATLIWMGIDMLTLVKEKAGMSSATKFIYMGKFVKCLPESGFPGQMRIPQHRRKLSEELERLSVIVKSFRRRSGKKIAGVPTHGTKGSCHCSDLTHLKRWRVCQNLKPSSE